MATLREEAYGKITGLLNAGRLTPGTIVSQRELVESTGSPLGGVREAIPRLEAEGLLIPLRKRGLMVPTIDVAFVRNAYHLRRILEMEAIRAAPDTIGQAALSRWEAEHLDLLDEIGRNPEQDLVDRVQTVDWALHQNLIDSLGNRLITSVYSVNAIKVRMATQARLQVTSDNAVRVLKEHMAFLEALKKGDIAAAGRSLELHLRNSLTLALGGTLIP